VDETAADPEAIDAELTADGLGPDEAVAPPPAAGTARGADLLF
jgi:hypothetical protein